MTAFASSGAELPHGGNLGNARRQFPDAPEPWVDLSTGINPFAYPVPPLEPEVFQRLPEPDALLALQEAAGHTYGGIAPTRVVAAPGTQILLPHLARLISPGRAAILAPTYAEHARAAALAGHKVEAVATLADLASADLAVLVNPNNPDGRLLPRTDLLELADRIGTHGGLLIVDEAFMDVGPEGASLAADIIDRRLVVLRSFGKFHGLAGIRLGFALANPEIASNLRSQLGPWIVSGPALAIGIAALGDSAWAYYMRAKLIETAQRLDALLQAVGLEIVGGTSLFRLIRAEKSDALWEHLARQGILTRRFDQLPSHLRFGLPGNEAAWGRLETALRGA
ncbi:threonine-phosphate decarboxylase CobD [Lacibacterium aquatile]|uniref:threonine-phosphate decarboxylase n=1 Tax=Lacibacterium aquatile TaxID=1168082 RepID=A0ABW5DTZ5_9PROT